MNLSLQQNEKTRAEWAEETISERKAVAEITATIVAAELTKIPEPIHLIDPKVKSSIVAYSIQLAFTIARGVALEDIRRHGQRIDMV